MRIVITGATGFIGSNLAKLFLKKGAEVFVLVRPESTHLDVLPKDEKLHVVSCGLSNVMDCVSYIKEADAFFHLAWGGVNRQEIDSPEVQAKNVAGSLDCIRAAKALNCRMFMDAGSRVEYGLTDGFMQEDIECHPVNQYGKAKWEFYQKAVPLCEELGLHYVHLRFFSVYGTGDHPWSIISTLVRELPAGNKVSLSACRHQWNFMYIEDAVQAVYELYRHLPSEKDSPKISEIVNVASRDTRVLRSFVEEVWKEAGGRGSLEYGSFVQAKEGALSVRPSVEKLAALTGGFKEAYSFSQGIRQMLP